MFDFSGATTPKTHLSQMAAGPFLEAKISYLLKNIVAILCTGGAAGIFVAFGVVGVRGLLKEKNETGSKNGAYSML